MEHTCSIGLLNGACNNGDHTTVREYPCGCIEHHNPTYWASRWWDYCAVTHCGFCGAEACDCR